MKYDWKDAGEEWSAPWGTSSAQWFGAILPRIRDCVPTRTILEIAPGYGQWTHYLKDYCQELWIVDRIDECIEACRRRFAGDSHVRCYVNDGRSLSMIPDASVDFIFSSDSFVHTNREVLEAYLRELETKLKMGGKGFIHHSNFGEYVSSVHEHLPQALAKLLVKAKILDWAHHRTPDMSADLFRALCAEQGLHCLSQELINWRGRLNRLFFRIHATRRFRANAHSDNPKRKLHA
jgi:ubiquinone/menaquinone biosynthesis C-methylase UbiE